MASTWRKSKLLPLFVRETVDAHDSPAIQLPGLSSDDQLFEGLSGAIRDCELVALLRYLICDFGQREGIANELRHGAMGHFRESLEFVEDRCRKVDA